MPYCEETHLVYLLQEGFVKLAKSTLKRKYANTPSHHSAAKSFIVHLVGLLAEMIPKEFEVISTLSLLIRL